LSRRMSSRDPVIRIFDLGPSRGVRMLPAGNATAVFGRGGGMRARAARARAYNFLFFIKLIIRFYFILKPHPALITTPRSCVYTQYEIYFPAVSVCTHSTALYVYTLYTCVHAAVCIVFDSCRFVCTHSCVYSASSSPG